MEAIEIDGTDLGGFRQILGEDLSDDLKRLYYRGIGVEDDEGNPLGAMVCELMNADSEEETGSRICFLQSGSKEAFDVLHDYYRENTVEDEEVSESAYELADEEAAKALSEVGFSSERKESDNVVVTLGLLRNSKLVKTQKPPAHIRDIGSLSAPQYRNALKKILFRGHNGILEDIAYLPMNWFDTDISSCVVSGDLIPGLFLIRKTPSGMLIPALYFAYGADFKRNLLYMLTYSAQKAMQCYPPETPVLIMRKNAPIRGLSDKLIPGQKGAEVFCGMRKE